jgi:prepilin-type N-terminal cleavage/methylation domain-containing protein
MAMRKQPLRRGFTLRELLAVVTIICVLLALLVPLIQASRVKARRTQCGNNLKNINLGLLNYHDTYKTFPMGAMHSGPNPGGGPPINAALGPSWWFGIAPFTEQRNAYDRVQSTQIPGGPVKHQFCANDMAPLFSGNVQGTKASSSVNKLILAYMRCPSSPLPAMETPIGPICLPTYVGIAGGCDIDPRSQDYQPTLVPPKTNRLYHNAAKGTGAAAGGIVTSSGMLPPCEHVRLADCLDGTSNTMIVGEQSDWLLDQNQAKLQKYHGDAGWTVGGTGPGGGWLSGTTRVDPVPKPGGPPATWGADCWNITTVRYPPNCKRVMGAKPLPGCSENHGINNPLQSPHPGGLLVAFVDGSVQFITGTTDLAILLRLAIRNDGLSVVFE